MKKISYVILLVAMVMASCGSSYKPSKKVKLKNEVDSINYALGVLNGMQLKEHQMQDDEKFEKVPEFVDALKKGYASKKTRVALAGENFAKSIKNAEKVGLAENPLWKLKEPIFFQGLANGFFGDSSVIDIEEAKTIATIWMTIDQVTKYEEEKEAGEPEIANAVKTPKKIDLGNDRTDTLNYAMGVLQGSDLADAFKADTANIKDVTKAFEEFVDALNSTKNITEEPSILVTIGEQIGYTIHDQEAVGLMGIKGLATKFDLIVQGFINGIYGETTIFDLQSANEFISSVLPKYAFADLKKENEEFIAENAKKEGITVTASGLQYEVVKLGTGEKPAETDTIVVHYTGKLIDGTVFDSSVERGEPLTGLCNGFIKGWVEGLQLMPTGSKFIFYIPQELAYGANAPGGAIKPYSALIFEVELLEVKKAVAPTATPETK